MPKIHEMLESKFLKKEDVGAGALLTVERVTQKNVAKEGADPELKWCMSFVDSDKPLVLNSTNIQLCQKVFDSDDTDFWVGKQIVLYTDPNVTFAGKVVGGIRVRKPRLKAPAPAASPSLLATPQVQGPLEPVQRTPSPAVTQPLPAAEIFEDDIPF